MRPALRYEVVIPTAGRAALGTLLPALAAGDGPLPERVLVVDDRLDRSRPVASARHLGPLVDRVFADRAGASYFFVVARASQDGATEYNRKLSEQRAHRLTNRAGQHFGLLAQ